MTTNKFCCFCSDCESEMKQWDFHSLVCRACAMKCDREWEDLGPILYTPPLAAIKPLIDEVNKVNLNPPAPAPMNLEQEVANMVKKKMAALQHAIRADRNNLLEDVSKVNLNQPEDKINPPHYKDHPSGVECIVITEHFNFCLGNAIKYIWRAGKKGEGSTRMEDLMKAQWYLDREIVRLTEDIRYGRKGTTGD